MLLRLLGGQVVGNLEGERAVFPVQRSRHYFRKVGGYSVDAEIVRRLPPRSILEFHDTELDETFRVPLDLFERAAVCVDYGFELKVCAPDRIYARVPKSQLGLFDEDHYS